MGKPKIITSFTVKRSKWLRGMDGSVLFDSYSEKMCCLGFLARKCGLSTDEINDLATPEEANDYSDNKKFAAKAPYLFSDDYGYNVNSDLCLKAMKVNDNPKLSNKKREEQLKKIFGKAGVEIRFVS